MADDRFPRELAKQLSFIRNSCNAYDDGEPAEAVRIGTCLRVLLHDTPKATSLLTHLGSKQVPMLSTAMVLASIPYDYFFDSFARFPGPRPKLGDSSAVELPASEWWQQLVIGLGKGRNLSRAVIALTAANKDGGAHVDPDLPPEYIAMVAGVWVKDGGRRIGDHHLLYLRQMGYEVLNSPRLVALAA